MNYQAPAPKKGLPWWGILLICFGLCLLLGVAAIVGVGIWFSKNKDRIAQGAEQTLKDAETFAATHDQNACVDEGLVRSSKCDGIWCTAQQQLYVASCLDKAEKSPTLCDDAPKPGEIMATANWAVNACKKRGRTDQACTQVMQAIPQYCQRRPH